MASPPNSFFLGTGKEPRREDFCGLQFYLGTHEPSWLGKAHVPLFVSRRRLVRLKKSPKPALAPWALDSGGFSELSLYGGWKTTAREYVADVRRWREQIGLMDWAAPQDWMCEPDMLAKTKKTVREHQDLTVANYLELKALAPDLPFVPVLQGWKVPDDYLECLALYEAAGINLHSTPVGVGTLCRRQHTDDAVKLLSTLCDLGLCLHGFGLKLKGLARCLPYLHSADSMAWSFWARKNKLHMARCKHPVCHNCIELATQWRTYVLQSVTGHSHICPCCQYARVHWDAHTGEKVCPECGHSWPQAYDQPFESGHASHVPERMLWFPPERPDECDVDEIEEVEDEPTH